MGRVSVVVPVLVMHVCTCEQKPFFLIRLPIALVLNQTQHRKITNRSLFPSLLLLFSTDFSLVSSGSRFLSHIYTRNSALVPNGLRQLQIHALRFMCIAGVFAYRSHGSNQAPRSSSAGDASVNSSGMRCRSPPRRLVKASQIRLFGQPEYSYIL